MARKIVITGGKGGVGKSTICLGLGIMLARTLARVVMLDVDVGLNNLDVVAGIEGKIKYDIVDVIEGRVRINEAIIRDDVYDNLYYLPSCHTYNTGKVTADDLHHIVQKLSPNFDYILIDCPAGIDFGFHRAVFCASEAIIVTTPHLTAIRDADKVATLLCHYPLDGVGLVVNRIPHNTLFRRNKISAQDVANVLKLPLLAEVCESDILDNLPNNGTLAIDTDKRLSGALQGLAQNVFFGEYCNRQNYLRECGRW